MAKTQLKRKMSKPTRASRAHKGARRARGKISSRGRVAKSKASPKRQNFVASHHSVDAFEQGLRRYAQYRDLGIAAATNGMVRAHVIKFIPPFVPAEVSKRHYHDVEFQMIYVLKGWMKSEFEGQGVITMREGSCWIQPPKIKHTVLSYSDDCEVLEIILPADFETVELE
jgi:mannose-6-phosphate isomerase-like protein (cupin superfamily)